MRLSNFFGVLGFSLIAYAMGRLILSWSLFREDAGKDNLLDKVLPIVSICFFVFSIPSAIIIHAIFSYPNKRAERYIRKEVLEKAEELKDSAVRSAVSEEHDKLVSFYRDMLQEQRGKIHAEESEKYRERLHEILDKRKAEER